MLSRTFSYEIQFWTTFTWRFFWCEACFWQQWVPKWVQYVEFILQNMVNWCSPDIHIGIMCCNLVENIGNNLPSIVGEKRLNNHYRFVIHRIRWMIRTFFIASFHYSHVLQSDPLVNTLLRHHSTFTIHITHMFVNPITTNSLRIEKFYNSSLLSFFGRSNLFCCHGYFTLTHVICAFHTWNLVY